MVKDYLNQINGKLNDDVNMFTGGINSYMDKAFIQPYQVPYAMNMTMYKPPMICTRPSRESVMGALETSEIVAMWAYNEQYVIYVIRNEDDAVLKLYDINSHATTVFGFTLPWSETYYFCYARQATAEYLYVCNDSFKIKLTINQYGVLSSEEITDNHYGIPAFHKGRMFFANETTNIITYSALWDFDSFEEFPDMSMPETLTSSVAIADGSSTVSLTTGAYNTGEYNITLNGNELLPKERDFYYDSTENKFVFDVGTQLVYNTGTSSWDAKMFDYSSYSGDFLVTNSKGSITNIVSFDDKLVIFSQHSTHVMYGDTPLTTSGYQFQLVDMNNNLGCLARKSIAVGGGRLFWLGDDNEVYAYTGSNIEMISRPTEDGLGGISNIPLMPNQWSIGYDGYPAICATATSDKYYITLSIDYRPNTEERRAIAYPVMVYDIYNKIWWAEDGALSSICNLSFGTNKILMARNGDIFRTTEIYSGVDNILDSEGKKKEVPISYEFHTRVYGADGVNSRKTLSKVYVQGSADADVYLTDSWTSTDYWTSPYLNNTLKKIGTLTRKGRDTERRGNVPYNSVYESGDYEQQVCYVEKMYGQRLNTFQVVIKGTGASKFYLMKREWSAR